MVSVEERVQEQIRSDLDDKQGAISGGALKRNASMIESYQGAVQFSAIGKKMRTKEVSRESSVIDCSVCNGTSDKSTAKSFQKSPFKESSEYYVPRTGTHREVKCEYCNGSGQTECRDCSGDGFEECFDCRGDGYEIVSEDCDVCSENSENTDCQACDGSGQIEYKKSCTRCNGTGRESCRSCGGDGLDPCRECSEEGILHEYKELVAEINSEYSSTGLPEVWADNHRAIAAALSLPQSKFTVNGDEYWFQTEKVDAYFVRYEYSDNVYEVVVADITPDMSVAWDPNTSYPKTNLRRKIGDLKSRFLDHW